MYTINQFAWQQLFSIILSFSYHSSFALKVIEHKPYDHKADVFSFAVVLWEILTGKVLLGGDIFFFLE